MDRIPTILFDYFLLTLDKRFESESESGLISVNESYIAGSSAEEEGWEKNPHKRIYGNVISCPEKFSDHSIFAIDPGSPNPKRYIGSAEIENKVKIGMRNYSRADYSPTMYGGVTYITPKTISEQIDIREGDRIYFDQKVTELENCIGEYKDEKIFKARVDEIICVVRDGEIITQGGWVLVKPDMESWEEITTEGGLIRKPRPDVKYLEGTVFAGNFVDDISPEDNILYHPDADWPVKVEGVDCYAIQGRDILGKK